MGRLGFAATISAAIAVATAAPALAAAPAGGHSDLDCFLLSNFFSNASQRPQDKQAAVYAHFYYLGALRAKMSAKELAAALPAAVKGIDKATAGATMQACATAVQAASNAAQVAGGEASHATGR